MDRKLMEALRLVQGRGQMSAKDKFGWHPPLEDDGDAMPNQPRDIRNLDAAPEPYLEGKTAADFGQDQFGTPSPNAEKMQKAVGALRLPPVVAPEQPTMKDLMGIKIPSEDFDPMASEFATQNARDKGAAMLVSVDPSSYTGNNVKTKPMGSGFPMTMSKLEKKSFGAPLSDTAFEIGGEDDPLAGKEPWSNMAELPQTATMPEGWESELGSSAQPETSRGPAGPQPGANLDPGLTEDAQPEDLSALEGFPEEIPTEDLTDEIDIDTGTQPGATAQPELSELQRYIAEMNGKGEQANDQRDSSFLDSQQKMNSDMGLYKLLFASANKIGSHAGQQSSDEPFNSFADGFVKSNDKRSELMAKDKAANKQKQDDKLKALMFMDKQKQDKEKYGEELDFRRKTLEQLAFDKDEGRKVQRESNETKNDYLIEALRAQMGLGRDKLELSRAEIAAKLGMSEAEMNAKLAAQNEDRELKRNPPLDALQKKKLEREEWEMNNLKNGLDKDGKKIKTKVQEKQESDAVEVYSDWIQKGGKNNVEANIQKLKDVKAKILADKMSSGPVQGWIPESAQTFLGMKGPTYQSDVEDAIASTYKETLGGSFTMTEGEALKKNAYDPKQTPEENARRVQRVIDKMEAGKRAKDQTVKYLDENGGIQLPGGAPAQQSNPGTVKIQAPNGDIREVPAASADKYLKKGGKLVQ